MFAAAREAAGTGSADVVGATVGDVLKEASARFGAEFVSVLQRSNVWLNGERTELEATVTSQDEVAVLPPVSGGAK